MKSLAWSEISSNASSSKSQVAEVDIGKSFIVIVSHEWRETTDTEGKQEEGY